jgi:hypothetical protein
MALIIMFVVLGASLVGCTSPTMAIPSTPDTGGTDMAVVTVAASGYTGKADYYCTGTDDQLIINAAIEYVSEAYGGGTVQLLEGTFNLSNSIIPLSYIVLSGNGDSTVLKANLTIGTVAGEAYVIKAFGPTVLNFAIKNLLISNITFSGTVTKPIGICLQDTNNCVIDNITITPCPWIAIGMFTQADYNNIRNCRIIGSTSDDSAAGIFSAGTNILITGNTIRGLRSTGSIPTSDYPLVAVVGIIYTLDGAIVSNNTVYDISTSAVSKLSAGIIGNSNRSTYSANKISDVKNTTTAANAVGLYIAGGSNNSVTGNYAYNNGSDTGIANTNSKNFNDSGTDTQCYSNSWQSPVASEPSLGTLHLCASGLIAHASYNGATLTAGTTYTIDWSASVPVGTTAVLMNMYAVAAGNFLVNFYRDAALSVANDVYLNYGSHYQSDHITVRLDAARKCYMVDSTTNCTLYLKLVGYYC